MFDFFLGMGTLAMIAVFVSMLSKDERGGR